MNTVIEIIPEEEINAISILRGTFGCPSGNHADIDPYYNISVTNLHEAARGDGYTYSGVLEVVERQPGESFDNFKARAQARANELDKELHCSRCYF